MKKILLSLLLLVSTSAFAQDYRLRTIFEKQWHGFSSTPSNLSDSGKIETNEKLTNVSYDVSTDTFTALSETTLNTEYSVYKTVVEVKGTVSLAAKTVTLVPGMIRMYDPLPRGLHWIHSVTTLTIYNDSDHPGYYILKESNMDGSYTEYSDRQ